ncbi:ABC transporter permease [Thermoflavimicrobium dichotomicum]|uniref:ABC-2 type transport system permease protein n=1 Tax=Thermoflavimicrobium dichotomicum TaxID=46223 RepID=A0A1I3SL01_9BACL|nr:ABC transporter permease [Thermoflavimicrobium dichotomicum]SFJ59468.1 hypothetical protein SAMN05421852_11393 [Thermoflavimicrobium dichotomicum]
MFFDVIITDWIKIRRSVVWWIMLAVPIFISIIGVNNYMEHLDVFQKENLLGWMGAWTQVEFLYGMVLLPIVISVYVSLLCRYEHLGGGWKQMLSYPITRTSVYLSKMVWSMILVGLTNVVMLVVFLALGSIWGVQGEIPWSTFLTMMINGWIATFTLIAIQLWVSTQWDNFSVPIILNFIFVFPNIFISNTKMGMFFPWSQPVYAMTPADRLEYVQPLPYFYLAVCLGFLIFIIGGLWHFHRSEIR